VPRFSSFTAKAFRWLIGAATVFIALYWGVKVGTYSGCFTDVLGKASGISGFDFEISETECWHDPAVSVFVSKAGHSTKTRLFQYTRGANPVPVITLLGKDTVQISLSSVGAIACRRDRWGPLTIKYDIGAVEYPSVQAQLPEC
jgi:hypothetical protein